MHIKRLLRSIVKQIEREFPTTTAAFEGFANTRNVVRDQMHIEVFNVKRKHKEAMQELVDKITKKSYPNLSVLMWNMGETQRYFKADLRQILRNRNTHRRPACRQAGTRRT